MDIRHQGDAVGTGADVAYCELQFAFGVVEGRNRLTEVQVRNLEPNPCLHGIVSTYRFRAAHRWLAILHKDSAAGATDLRQGLVIVQHYWFSSRLASLSQLLRNGRRNCPTEY